MARGDSEPITEEEAARFIGLVLKTTIHGVQATSGGNVITFTTPATGQWFKMKLEEYKGLWRN